ncbi:MAG: molecular chaperone TorD family protein [Helicobacter sp.]|nr:molecular chaperone TorD family protein [Helicobacter sp.]
MQDSQAIQIQDFTQTLNLARSLYYDFFAGFFLFELLVKRKDLILRQISILSQHPIGIEDSARFAMLQSYLQDTTMDSVIREYTQTFNLPFATKNLPKFTGGKKGMHANIPNPQVFLYLSHYKDGCLNGESLIEVKKFIKQTHFRLNAKEFKESEDHLGFLLLLMRHLLQDSSKYAKNSQTLSREIFHQCILPMGVDIAKALQDRELACYGLVGALFESFLHLEQHA